MFYLRTLFLSCLLLIFYNGYAQIPSEAKNIQSPNATSFAIFGEVPISYYSGIPSIQVPLYTVKENEIAVPLALNYHAGGFKPDMHPGWVGLNWNFTAGGVITRTVKDMRDDYYFNGIQPEHRGYYYNHNVNNDPNWETVNYLKTIVTSSYNSDGDTEPDEFSFNFPGYSGSFYMDHLGNWKVNCDRPVRVEFDGSMIPTCLGDTADYTFLSFSGFTITDEFGNKYIFGIAPSAIEYGTSFFAAGEDIWTAQAWYLTRIIHADGYEVVFDYERDDYINQMYNAFNRTSNYYTPSGGGFLDIACTTPAGSGSDLKSSYSGKLISPVYLSRITTSSEIIRFKRSTTTELKYSTATGTNDYQNPYEYRRAQLAFNYPSQTPQLARVIQQTPGSGIIADFYTSLQKLKFKQLDTVEIQDRYGNIKRQFKFYYTANTAKRLALDSLREIGRNNETIPCYKFAYKGYGGGAEPPYLDNKNDHWGYYNNTFGDLSDWNTYYNNRNTVNTSYALYGIIDSIIYPTGGVTKFTFEQHRFYKRLQEIGTRGLDNSFATNTYAGGVRVKRIESYDKSTPTVKKAKDYYYVSNYSSTSNTATDPSSGILGKRAKYYFENYKIPVLSGGGNYEKFCFSAQSVLPGCENSAGTHVAYSEVTEKLSDGSYTRFFYNNYGGSYLDDSALVVQDRTPYEQVASKSIERGTLKGQEDYSSTNVLLKKKVAEYIALNKASEYVRGIDGGIGQVCPSGSTDQAYEGTAYKIYTYSYLPSSEVITEYSQNGVDSLVTQKYMFYNNTTRLLVKDSTISSRGQPVCNYFYYPADVLNYTPSVNAPLTQPVAYMKQKNMIGNIIQTLTTRTNGSSETITGLSLTTYQAAGSLVKPYKQYSFSQPATQVVKGSSYLYKVGLSGSTETGTLPLNVDLVTTFSSYDLRGNVTTYAKDQDINHALLWKDNFQYPVAKVVNSYNNLTYAYSAVTKQLTIKKPEPLYNTTGSFRHYQQGTIKLSLNWDGTPPPGSTAKVDILMYGPQFKTAILKPGDDSTFINMPAGIYSLIINAEAFTPLVSANITVTYNGQQAVQTSYNTSSQFFYEGFEEATPSGVKPFAGKNCNNGDYTVPYVVPSGGVYLIDYRYLDAGTWKYRRRWYSNNMTITEGDAIDEVRVYRTDARISTYTYDAAFGMTSQNDFNGKTANYFYDGLGRLAIVKDHNLNILKKICYNYYGQTQNCIIDTSAAWELAGETRCKPCPANPAYYFSTLQRLKRNANPHSATYNDTTWIDDGYSAACVMTIPPSWVPTGAPLRCEKNGVNNNTGQREQEQIDTNSCSSTYNTKRWVVYDTNTSACPINLTNVLLTTTSSLGGGYISFTGPSGTTTFNFPYSTVTNYNLGTIPFGEYDITIYSGGSSRTFYANGMYAFYGTSNTIYNLPVGGTNWVLSAN